MSFAIQTHKLLIGINTKEIVSQKSLRILSGIFVFIILTSLGAFVRIPLPFTPVPITLQTLFVLLSGAFLGGIGGFASQAGYILLGVSGFPIYAGANGGILHLLGPTGGYLFSFPISSFITGVLVRKGKLYSFSGTIISMLIASIFIYFLGTLQLAIVVKCGFSKALFMGVLPFLFGDTLKLLIAATFYQNYKKRIKFLFG